MNIEIKSVESKEPGWNIHVDILGIEVKIQIRNKKTEEKKEEDIGKLSKEIFVRMMEKLMYAKEEATEVHSYFKQNYPVELLNKVFNSNDFEKLTNSIPIPTEHYKNMRNIINAIECGIDDVSKLGDNNCTT